MEDQTATGFYFLRERIGIGGKTDGLRGGGRYRTDPVQVDQYGARGTDVLVGDGKHAGREAAEGTFVRQHPAKQFIGRQNHDVIHGAASHGNVPDR